MRKRSRKLPRRKIVLRLPDLDHTKAAVLNSLSSPHSRRNYKFAMEQFITWYCSEPRLALNRAVVLRFRLYLESLGLAAGTINQRLAAVRRLAYEAADSGLLSPELAAGIRRVKGVKQLGARLGNWLTSDQAKLLLARADGEDLRSVRDPRHDGCAGWAAAYDVPSCRLWKWRHADQAGTLGHRRPDWQGQPREDGSHAHVAQRGSRSLDSRRQDQCGPDLQSCQPAWNALGKWDLRKCHLVRG